MRKTGAALLAALYAESLPVAIALLAQSFDAQTKELGDILLGKGPCLARQLAQEGGDLFRRIGHFRHQ